MPTKKPTKPQSVKKPITKSAKKSPMSKTKATSASGKTPEVVIPQPPKAATPKGTAPKGVAPKGVAPVVRLAPPLPKKRKRPVPAPVPDPKRIGQKIREFVDVVHATGEDLAEIGPLLERFSEWSHQDKWNLKRHRRVGEALAAKYKALIDGGVPADLANNIVMAQLGEKSNQDSMISVLRSTTAMGPAALKVAVGGYDDVLPPYNGRNRGVLHIPGDEDEAS